MCSPGNTCHEFIYQSKNTVSVCRFPDSFSSSRATLLCIIAIVLVYLKGTQISFLSDCIKVRVLQSSFCACWNLIHSWIDKPPRVPCINFLAGADNISLCWNNIMLIFFDFLVEEPLKEWRSPWAAIKWWVNFNYMRVLHIFSSCNSWIMMPFCCFSLKS